MKDLMEELPSFSLHESIFEPLSNGHKFATFTNPIKNLVASDVGLASFHEDQFHNHTNISC